MHSRVRWTLAVATVAFGAACVLLVTLPPRPRVVTLPPELTPSPTVVRGAFHIHTDRSDGSGSVETIAAAAAAADLQFVIFTDHGDGTRAPDPPTYRSGVLCLDGVEISTRGGHYIAVGLVGPTPYPLGGEAAGVVEDVRRLGGFGVVAHPTSPKTALEWSDPTLEVDGFEWLNGDSQWRDEPWAALFGAAARYVIRPAGAIASLLDRPEAALAWWDTAPTRSIVGLAGSDAHARLALGRGGEGEGYEKAVEIPFPGYRAVFETFASRVELRQPWSGEPAHDAAVLLEGLRAGRTFSAIDAFATPVGFRFFGRVTGREISMGSRVTGEDPVELWAHTAAPPGSTVVLLANGQVVHETTDAGFVYLVSGHPGTYRVEVRLPSVAGVRPLPWVVSNPIYIGAEPLTDTPLGGAPLAVTLLPAANPDGQFRWATESDTSSSVEIGPVEGPEGGGPLGVGFSYRLGDEPSDGTYAAAVYPIERGQLADNGRFVFRAGADHPLRLSVQLRASELAGQPRWRRSVYVGTDLTDIVIPLSSLAPTENNSSSSIDLEKIDAILIVIDLTNSSPGAAGQLTIRDARLERE